MEESARRQRLLRVALALQALGLLAIVALTVPDYIDAVANPLVCTTSCLDLRGLPFELGTIGFGPVILLLLLLSWRWRGPRRWPVAVVAVVDAAAFALVVSVVIDFVHTRADWVPPVASLPPLLLLPALTTIALGANLLRPVPWKPIVAVSAAGSLLFTGLLSWNVVGPVHQRIPGELSLPFIRTAVYAGRDLGCRDYEAGWTLQHECLRATLLVYRGSGDPSKDQTTINYVLLAEKRIRPVDENVGPLPVAMAVNRTYSTEVDPNNAGLCLIITDRVAAAPSPFVLGRCGMAPDYVDIRSHWPADDAYAIGIIYYYFRPDYRDQPSVTFLNAPFSANPGHAVTLRVHASPNTLCTVVVADALGQSSAQGLDPKTSDAAGDVAWTWWVDATTTPGLWPITVRCGAASGQTYWWVYPPSGN